MQMIPTTISEAHQRFFEDMKRNLVQLGSKESNFIQVEILFYQAISIAREYGEDPASNKLLAALKALQADQYRETTGFFKKSAQRERKIKHFNSQLRQVITSGIRGLLSGGNRNPALSS
jgi:hypothetical protein